MLVGCTSENYYVIDTDVDKQPIEVQTSGGNELEIQIASLQCGILALLLEESNRIKIAEMGGLKNLSQGQEFVELNDPNAVLSKFTVQNSKLKFADGMVFPEADGASGQEEMPEGTGFFLTSETTLEFRGDDSLKCTYAVRKT